MAYTSYPFDNQDTSEAQYSALFRELQDSGVIDGYGGTGLQIGANSSGMEVTMQPGAALVRGHKFDSDATVTLPIGAAGGAVRYDAVILRLDPASNSILPVVVANAAPTPVLTQTTTGIFEILLAVVTVNAGAASIASGNVADKRLFVRHRVGVWASTNRPVSPRPYEIGMAADKGGRIEHYDPATTAWVSRVPVHWGSGTAYPTAGIQAGDTFVHNNLGPSLMRYNGGAWRQVEPIEAASKAAIDAVATNYGASLPIGSQARDAATGIMWTWYGSTTGGWVALGQWSQVVNSTYSWTIPVTGTPQTLPGLQGGTDASFVLRCPAGRTADIEMQIPAVQTSPGTAYIRLNGGGAIDGATISTNVATYQSLHLAIAVPGNGSDFAVFPQAWCAGGTVAIKADQAGGAPVRIRWRFV